MRRALSLVLKNFSAGPETRRFPERVPPAGRFRGAVLINTERCIGCGICDHVCISGAIEIIDRDGHINWSYDVGRCTFCASCVLRCPVGALKQEPDRPATYESPDAVLVCREVPFPTCEKCGTPVPPVRGEEFHKLLEMGPAEVRKRAHTCASCAETPADAPADAQSREPAPEATPPDKPNREEDSDGR
jgi:formate hydrogenlyase subunit 6/NADH:ubiquinone oxidoreductase subunit I